MQRARPCARRKAHGAKSASSDLQGRKSGLAIQNRPSRCRKRDVCLDVTIRWMPATRSAWALLQALPQDVERARPCCSTMTHRVVGGQGRWSSDLRVVVAENSNISD